MLVLNSLRDAGAGFGTDTNKVSFVFPDGVTRGELKSKQAVANDILNEFEVRYA
jgi:phosphopantothenoylcysteine decarboxylase/phosphopantothenate--cysteine ligase